MAHQYKLIYFDSRGRAELIRLVFAVAGQSYEDVRLTSDQFRELKPELPFGQLPALQIDGDYFAQSHAIAMYLSREFGFYGNSNMEAFQIEQVLQYLSDLSIPLAKAFYHEKDPSTKEQLVETLKKETIPKAYGNLEKLLATNKTGFFAGSKLSLADIALFDLSEPLAKFNVLDLDAYPLVKANGQEVASHEKIVEYLKSRP